MKNCLICLSTPQYPICKTCRKNPFRVEKCRQLLAQDNKLQILQELYQSKYSEIKDLNTSRFWDTRLKVNKGLKFENGMTKDRVKAAARFLSMNSAKILDIGAGYGFVEELLSDRLDLEIYGNDISPKGVKLLNERFPGIFKVESIYNMKYRANPFDAVLALEVLEHIPPRRILKVLRNIHEIIKKNGLFIVSVPMNEGLENMEENLNGHVRDYTVQLISSELKLTGFKVLNYKTFYAFNNNYLIKKQLAKIFKDRWRPNNVVIQAKKVK